MLNPKSRWWCNAADGFFICTDTTRNTTEINHIGGFKVQRVINIYISDNVVKELDEMASKEGRSRSNYVTHIIKQAIRQTRKS